MYRIAFDPSLPVVAASPFNAGEKSFSAGDPVDWRALGVTELTLRDWWLAQLVVHPLEAVKAPVSAQASTLAAMITPGETVHVTPPEPRTTGKPQRHARR